MATPTEPVLGIGEPTGGAGSDRYLNRELSWLAFNERVLALAEDPSVPLLERAKFLAIFNENLDEFFQVRVAGLKDQLEAGLGATSSDGRTPAGQLLEVREHVAALLARQILDGDTENLDLFE